MVDQIFEEREIQIETPGYTLYGNLSIPDEAQGIVLFAHGSGSSRFSSRNRFVARYLYEGGLATLLFDLLTVEEEKVDRFTREFRFDIPRLAERLVQATDWTLEQPETEMLNVGYFGASTGAAAALIAAVRRPDAVDAVVSRGGRPDLAGAALAKVEQPTLLIVGSRDVPVIGMNEEAQDKMDRAEVAQIELVPGATHLFEEPGTLEQAAKLARSWFQKYLA